MQQRVVPEPCQVEMEDKNKVEKTSEIFKVLHKSKEETLN